MSTVAAPNTMLPPCSVGSKRRAAGTPPMNTVGETIMMLSGTGDTQMQWLPIVAAGYELFSRPLHPGQEVVAIIAVKGPKYSIIVRRHAFLQLPGCVLLFGRNRVRRQQPVLLHYAQYQRE